MEDTFIKKYWGEEKLLLYLHFKKDRAVRQIEITPTDQIHLTSENPVQGEHMLYDQQLSDLDLDPTDFITEEEFNLAWSGKDNVK